MDSVDLSVLKILREWQAGDQPMWLVTVVETFGSSPRSPGAMFALRGDGQAVGSVSGGCIEDDLVLRAKRGELPVDRCGVLTFGVTREEARRFRLPCGGVIRVVVEPVHIRETGQIREQAQSRDWVEQVLQLVQAHRLVRRTLHFDSLRVELDDARRSDNLSFDGTTLVTVHGPRWRMLIIGAGQTSAYLARMAQALDYQVIVCDPRAEMRATWDVPDTALGGEMPDDAVLALQADNSTAIIALTHDPKLDDMALLEALKSPAFYVGALGSRANNAKRRERLALFDLTAGEIARLHGPVGLHIGSRTPPEIAVSILAHLIQVRNQMACHDQPDKSAVALQPGNQTLSINQARSNTQEVCS
ncbi:MAG TPA: XdhC family protein [Gallionella sp.]|nr:XdhC family protein [Gallionella sp.]